MFDAGDLPSVEELHDAIPISRLPDILPKRADGKKVALSTLWRHVLAKNERRLPTVKVMGRRYVLPSQLRQWLAQQSGSGAPRHETHHQRKRRAERAAEQLAREGL